MSLRDKILKAQDIPTETVTIPEWDVTLLVKGMSAGDRIDLMQSAYDVNTGQVNMSIVYPDVAVACAHEPETGEPVFTAEDKTAILSKSSAAVEKLANVGLRLSGIGKDEQDAAGKDSSSTENADSSSS
ncbi:MAG TPA: hypothetical protein VIG24_17735 [Acidimicrobiia bacterium]